VSPSRAEEGDGVLADLVGGWPANVSVPGCLPAEMLHPHQGLTAAAVRREAFLAPGELPDVEDGELPERTIPRRWLTGPLE
jgi:hypothetical protein